ncbi:MAG: hypothetical protein AAFW87_13960 [Pseudomonadota bacterium]
MGRYNVNFELSVEDMELIEDALRKSKSDLSSMLVDEPTKVATPCDQTKQTDTSMRRIHDLLGRLHNQKVFYRPKSAPYVSG